MGRIIQHHEIARNAAQAKYPHLWQGLVGAWYPSLGIQGSQIIDVSGNGNYGTANNAVWAIGKEGPAFNCNGTNCLDTGNDASLQISGKTLSVVASVYINTTVAWQGIVVKTGAWSDGWGLMVFNDATIRFFINNYNGGQHASIDISGRVGGWYHIIGVYDGTTIRLYVDGIPDGSTQAYSGVIVDINTNLMLGRIEDGVDNYYWEGMLSNIQLYNRVLTPAEIQLLYRTNGNALLQRRPSALFKAAAAGGTILPQIVAAYNRRSA